MTLKTLELTMKIPEKVTLTLVNGIVTVKGVKGEVARDLFDHRVHLELKGRDLHLSAKKASKREKKVFFTLQSHVKNMIEGVEREHHYSLKICSGHFPMNVSVAKGEFIVKNFFGEKVPRTLPVPLGIIVKVEGDQVSVSGVDLEKVSGMAASIEQLTRRSGFDRRIFQDGIYIVTKDGAPV